MSKFTLDAIIEPLTTKKGIAHAVLQSIHNHAEATKNDQARMGTFDRGGVWSSDLIGHVGSRDWTLQRTNLTDEVLSMAKRFYVEALQWLIDEGHVKDIEVSVWKATTTTMTRNILITLPDDTTFDVPLDEIEI